MTTLGEKLREAIEKKHIQSTLNAWDEHEDQIRKPQTQEKQMANPNPITNRSEDAPHFAVTNNVMRATFDAIKNAPNMTHREYVEMLTCRGFKESSSSSVIYQLVRSGQVVKDEHGNHRVVRSEYEPVKAPKKRTVQIVDYAPPQERKHISIMRRPKKKSDPSHGIAALTPDTRKKLAREAQAIVDAVPTRAFHPSAIVDQLTVLHARELYDYLKKIFGGN